MKHLTQRMIIIPGNAFNSIDIKSFYTFFKSVTKSIESIDHDRVIKNACEFASIDNKEISSFNNKTVNEFHKSVLSGLENQHNSEFLIFKN